jgi:hypothetical protein
MRPGALTLLVAALLLAAPGCKSKKTKTPEPTPQGEAAQPEKESPDQPDVREDALLESKDSAVEPAAADVARVAEAKVSPPDPSAEKMGALRERLRGARARLAKITGELAEAKTEWQIVKDADKIGLLDGFLTQTKGLDEELSTVQEMLAKGHPDLAVMKIDLIETQLETLSEKAHDRPDQVLPSDEEMVAMLHILAEETCLMRQKLPIKEFRVLRQKLFEEYKLGRAAYERLRAMHNKNPKGEHQLLLGEFIAKACPVAKVEDAGTDVKEPVGPSVTGAFAGKVVTPGVVGNLEFEVKDGSVSKGFLRYGGEVYMMRGGVGKSVLLVGRTADAKNHAKCTGHHQSGKLVGKCEGSVGTRKFQGAFTAQKTTTP